METVNQENNNVSNETPKTFTQDEVNAIIGERLSREREKFSDYEALKEKASELDAMKEASKSELEKAVEKANSLEAELTSLKKVNEVQKIRSQVASKNGIPIDLLSGETEEECQAQAEKLLDFKNANTGYPSVKDGGETHTVSKGSTREQFADWLNNSFN